MRRVAILLVVGIVAVAACSSGGWTAAPAGLPGPARTPACAGDSALAGTYQGNYTTMYCGSAVVTLDIGGSTYELTGGKCVDDATAGFALNIGTLVSGVSVFPTGGPEYFGVVAPSGAKTLVTGFLGGHVLLITDGEDGQVITVAADHKSGTVKGTTIELVPVTGSFRC